jgi:A/G-specific adenine glycosylase
VTRDSVSRAVVLPTDFAKRLLAWQAQHGRTGLPWQGTQDPYRVWLSEIMLQQTQVETVKTYYARFLVRFPSVAELAAASQDDVLALWAGLGYYSRARNLHACAQVVVHAHGGQFPSTAEQLQTLPGIGRSTAAAIASFCFGERVAILDGNVKRVITRVLAFDQDIANSQAEKQLWQMASDLLPTAQIKSSMPRYTQAIMDLGATICSARNPTCLLCPMQGICQAQKQGKPEAYPIKTKKLKRSSQSLWLLLARNAQGEVFLQKRPTPGVWAGLHCLPVFESLQALEAVLTKLQRTALHVHTPFTHVLTHKDLHLHVMELEWTLKKAPTAQGDPGQWVHDLQAVGLPAPIAKLLRN